jgi:hypothetical protein
VRHDYYHVQEWTPELKRVADELMASIHEVAPEVGTLFMGAAALGLPGKNDIDLDLLCDQAEVERYAQLLTPVLGSPQELKENMAIWSYMRGDIEVDCILSDPTTPNSHVPGQKKVFEKLQSSPELQERYRQLKYACDGLPYAEYEVKKKAFLQIIEAMED